MKTTVLTLEAHDDLISIRDKLAWAKSPRILLVWPKRRRRNAEAPLYLSRLDLTLLARQARQLGAQLALVTANAQVRAYAAEAGVAVFDSAEEAQDASWRRARRRRLSQIRRMRPAMAGGADSMASGDWRSERIKLQRSEPPAWIKNNYRLFRVAGFSLGILAVLALVLVFLPGAKISLVPARQTQQVRLGVWASPQVAQASVTGALPARIESVTVSAKQQIPSSGSVLIPESYAGGQVLFSNLSESALELPVGTVLRTLGDGEHIQRYELTTALRLPAGVGMAAQGAIRALLPGPEANVASNTIQSVEGALGGLVAVNNPDMLQGGSMRRVPAPTEQDYETLRAQLIESLRQSALQEVAEKFPDGDFVIADSMQLKQVELEQRTPLQGGAADALILSLRVEFTVLIVQHDDLLRVAEMALHATLPQGYIPAAGDAALPLIQLEQDFALSGDHDQRVETVLIATWQIEPAIAPWEVAQALVGRSPQEARDLLQAMFELEGAPLIELNPSWWPNLPLLPASIRVEKEMP